MDKRLEFCRVKFPFRGGFRPMKEASGWRSYGASSMWNFETIGAFGAN